MSTLSFEDWLNHLTTLTGVFVTGTDTSVGKTWIGVRLIQHLRQKGVSVRPFKPVESGWSTDVTLTDAWQLLQAAGLPAEQLAHVCPYPLAAPLAPARAAQLAGISLSIADLSAVIQYDAFRDWCYVEGAGGFYSPLAQDGLNADLAEKLQLPIILVAEDKLGCMNHILLTAEAIERRGLTLAGVILNQPKPIPQSMDNQYDLHTWLKVPLYYWHDQAE